MKKINKLDFFKMKRKRKCAKYNKTKNVKHRM